MSQQLQDGCSAGRGLLKVGLERMTGEVRKGVEKVERKLRKGTRRRKTTVRGVLA